MCAVYFYGNRMGIAGIFGKKIESQLSCMHPREWCICDVVGLWEGGGGVGGSLACGRVL